MEEDNQQQSTMPPPEPSYPMAAISEYSNTAGAQENNLKTNFVVEVLKEKMNTSHKEIQENTNKQ